MAFDIYLTIAGIPGESTNANYKNAIEVYSYSLGFSNSVTIGSGSGGNGAGKPSFSDLNITKKFDVSSPKLFQALATGKHLATMTLSLVKAGGAPGSASNSAFLTYKFSEVVISSIQEAGSNGGDDAPTESISFSYEAIELSYATQNSTGGLNPPTSVSWNIVANKSS